MTPFAHVAFVVAMGAWAAALLAGVLAFRGQGVQDARRVVRRGAPVLDLAGTWLGAIAALILVLGRVGYTFGWAAALGLDALMVTAALYDRAVLLPSLASALRRIGVGTDAERWESDFRFLWRMQAWTRAAMLAMALTAIAVA